MEMKEVVGLARNLVRQGDTARSLQITLEYLERNATFPETKRTLELLEANFNVTRQQEQKNILSFQEAQRAYSQINDALLEELDKIEAGRRPTTKVGGASNIKSILPWVIGGVLILAAGIFVGRRFMRTPERSSDVITAIECPGFAGVGPKVLILPFTKIQGADSRVDRLISKRINEVSTNNRFPIQVATFDKTSEDATFSNPSSIEKITEKCDADMIIYGDYIEKNGGVEMDARFFLRKKGLAGGTGFQKIKDLINITSDKKYRALDDAVFSLCGVLALGMENDTLAQKWFNKIGDKTQGDLKAVERLKSMPKRPIREALNSKRAVN